MRDGRTVRRDVAGAGRDEGFDTWQAMLVVIAGPGAGTEHPVEAPRWVIGRAPGADVTLVDDEISLQHAALEFAGDGFRAVDLGSTNGTRVNGATIESEPLGHGDRIEIGGHVLQLVLEKRDGAPPVYVLPDA